MPTDRLYKTESSTFENYWVPDPVIPNPISGVTDNTVIPPSGEGGWSSSPSGGAPPSPPMSGVDQHGGGEPLSGSEQERLQRILDAMSGSGGIQLMVT